MMGNNQIINKSVIKNNPSFAKYYNETFKKFIDLFLGFLLSFGVFLILFILYYLNVISFVTAHINVSNDQIFFWTILLISLLVFLKSYSAGHIYIGIGMLLSAVIYFFGLIEFMVHFGYF